MKTSLSLLALCALFLAGCAQDTVPGRPSSSTLKPVVPPAAVTLTDFKLTGNLAGDLADFTLTANAHVEEARGGSLDLLAGPVALTAIDPHPGEHIRAEQNRFILT